MSIVENLDEKIRKFWPKNGPPFQEVDKYIKKYSKEKIVIKCGGRVLLDPDLFSNFINDVTTLKKLGLTPVIVHGGGPRIKNMLERLKLKSSFVDGLRVTDKETMNIVEMVLSDRPVSG